MLFERKKSIMTEENNTDFNKNNQINPTAEGIDDLDLAIANGVDEIDVVTQEPELEIDNPDSLVVDVVTQEPELGIDNPDSLVVDVVTQEPELEDVVTQEPELEIDNPDSLVVDVVTQEPELEDVVTQEPELEIDNPDSLVVDVVAQDTVLGNSPAVAQSNNYQTMIEASIQALQNSVSFQQQLTVNSYTTTTKNLGFIYSKQRRVAQNNTTDEIFQMLEKLFPEQHSLIQKMQEARSIKSCKTEKIGSNGSQYLSSVIQMVKSLQGTSQGF